MNEFLEAVGDVAKLLIDIYYRPVATPKSDETRYKEARVIDVETMIHLPGKDVSQEDKEPVHG